MKQIIDGYVYTAYPDVKSMIICDYEHLTEAYNAFAKTIIEDSSPLINMKDGDIIEAAVAANVLVASSGSPHIVDILAACFTAEKQDTGAKLLYAGRRDILRENATVEQTEQMLTVFFLQFMENLRQKGGSLLVQLIGDKARKA